MFPYDDDDDLIEEPESEEVVPPHDYGINFDRGALTGVQVEGLPALREWAANALLTPRGRYEIFSDDFGSELETLIGNVYSPAYIEAESRRMVEECLTVHPNITGIDDFKAGLDGDRLDLTFTLITEYGDTELEVEV